MQWYKIELTQTQVANDWLTRLSREIQDKIMSLGSDKGTVSQLAAFSSEGERDCGETIYLSPILAKVSPELLSFCDAEPCDAPSDELLSVFASWDDDEAAWEILRTFKLGPIS